MCLCGAFSAFAQTHYESFIPNVFSKSPNAAAVQKFGDYPTNLFSGLPDISIPLYTAESGSLQVPITLSYHAGGIKVDQASTWVGLGWSIQAGGNVNRTVNGLPDDAYGYFYNYKHPYSYNTSSDQDMNDMFSIRVRQNKDSRPDMFSYNLPGGLSGKFFLMRWKTTA
ncbi:hypothetical protein CKK33_14540 [Mucilaginibacter sp. MD40]|nr:hypothetical protein CKK33_14540 [Mucilaginibacter sp. MD40]